MLGKIFTTKSYLQNNLQKKKYRYITRPLAHTRAARNPTAAMRTRKHVKKISSGPKIEEEFPLFFSCRLNSKSGYLSVIFCKLPQCFCGYMTMNAANRFPVRKLVCSS